MFDGDGIGRQWSIEEGRVLAVSRVRVRVRWVVEGGRGIGTERASPLKCEVW